jgi:hypothetical protein
MNNLSEKMQERLDRWKKFKNEQKVETKTQQQKPSVRRGGKNDYGDAYSEDEWEEEHKRSQTRR